MPTTSRRYHHGDLRSALVGAALGLARTDGPGGVSLREATRRAGVSPSAAYRHFRDRSHLLDAVARDIQERMAQRMRAAMEEPGAPATEGPDAELPAAMARVAAAERAVQRLRGVGLGYIGFAREEPGWFETAFFGRLPEAPPAADGVASAGDAGGAAVARGAGAPAADGTDAVSELARTPPPFALLTEALDECSRTGVLAPGRRAGAEFVCWSAVHGCAELILHGPLRGAEAALVQHVAERVVEDIVAGIR